MDKSLNRDSWYERESSFFKNKLISNNTEFYNICEYNTNDGFYEKEGYQVFNFKDIIETNIKEETIEDKFSEQPQQKQYMVSVSQGKAPKKIHETYLEAENEAKRLSELNLGKEVFVLEVKAKFVSKVIVEEIK